MKKKRIISLVICIVMILPLFAAFANAANKYQYQLFDPALDAQKTPILVNEGSVYGQRVILNVPSVGAAFCLPTWEQKESECTIGVFEWKGDFDSTVSAGAVYETRIAPMRDCATNELRFGDTLPAGEYFFAMYDTVNKAGIWRYPMTKSQGYVYMDGEEGQYDLQITVYLTEKTDNPVTACESIINVDGTMKTPPEYVIPDDDILYTRKAYADTWVAIDGLGRELPTYEQTGGVREEKYVGLFYWSWHTDRDAEPFNVSEFIAQYPEAKNDYNFKKWPSGVTFFWNEPIYGYYKTTDRWVIRRQAELLADAGVDVIFFDNTNGTFTWRSSYRVIFDVFEEARKDGVMTPAISFLLPFDENSKDTKAQLELLYMDIYRPGKYQDLWFYWNKKPLIMAGSNTMDTSALDKEIRKFFTFRDGQPTYDGGDGATEQWGWLSRYPQARYYTNSKDRKNGVVEQMSVGVAQNSSPSIVCTAMNGEKIFGRSYTHKDGFAHYEEEDSMLYGYNFAEQWEYALEVDPKFVFVTGWNEWIAGRYDEWGGVKNAFPDEYSDEYSRDIEPSKGPLKDHYYYQFVSYIRKFKGCNEQPQATDEKTIDIKGAASQWDDVGPYYVAYIGNTDDRDAKGYGSNHYTDTSCNNDIKGAKLARDGENLYIYIECEADVSPYTDPNWMNVYLDTVNGGLDGWESFDYVLKDAAADKITLYKFKGTGFDNEKVAECDYSVSGNVMQISVKRADIGITGAKFTVNFKVTDGVVLDNDILNFYTSGDVAPAGRFKYSYTGSGSQATPETETDTTVTDTETQPTETAAESASATETDESGEAGNKGGGTVWIIAGVIAALAVCAAAAVIIIRKKKK